MSDLPATGGVSGVSAERRLLALGLLGAALVYLYFAVVGGASTAWVAIETGGVLLFGFMALRGLRHSTIWLVAGWGLHAAWDSRLHLTGDGSRFVPLGYVVACIFVDLVIAIYAAWRTGRGL